MFIIMTDRLPSGKQVEILGNLCDGPDEVFDSVDTVNAGASKKRRKSAAQSAVPPPQKSVVPAVAAGTAPATPGTKTKPKATSNGPQQPASSSKSPSQGSSAKTAKSVHPAPNGSGHNKRK